MARALDPITLEVLRHRLWMINDEQGKVATQISGSPVVYEAKDFNCSLLTPEGDSLFVGVYTTRLSLCLNVAAKHIIAHLRENPGIRDGDAFITNDPWAGASHMNDFLILAPIFWEDETVAWSGIAMHEMDVGGPNPGSFTVGAKEVFGEAPVIPPVRLVEGGTIRRDIEEVVLRNSRTRELNALNIRARLAAINRTRERIHDVIREYGKETFLETQRRILDLVRRGFGRRLRELPDGTWREEGFLDHDGNRNRLYSICLEMTKEGERLVFDFTGTSPQAEGPVNCTRVGLEGGVFSAVLPALCYDMAWSPAALAGAIEIRAADGSINNARYPAAVSMATVAATFATQHVSSAAIAKMLACAGDPRYQLEAQANWTPTWQGAIVAGLNHRGERFTGTLLDQAGGGGARSVRDGVDTGGVPGSPSMGIANVETYERQYAILYVYRKHGRDTGGAGRSRGGVGTEILMIPHNHSGPLDLTVLCHGASQPEPRGLFGGGPASVQVRLLLRQTNLAELFRSGVIPTSLDEIQSTLTEALEAKDRTVMEGGDALLTVAAGGAGYGDPLERPADRVHGDYLRGLVSEGTARNVYGAMIDAEKNALDPAGTEERRRALRALRLQEAKPADPTAVRPSLAGSRGRKPLSVIGDCLAVVESEGELVYACSRCGSPYGPIGEDPKRYALMREVPITAWSEWNRYGLVGEIKTLEFYCPGCALMIGVQVRRKDDPPLRDISLRASAAALGS